MYILLIIMTLLGSTASLFFKQATKAENFFKMFWNWNLYVGGGLYLTSAILNIYILKYLEYSVALPLTAITYIWTMILSYWILKEKITKKKRIGLSLIIIGAVVVSM